MAIKKVFSSDIRKISTLNLAKNIGAVKINEEWLQGMDLKEYLKKEVSGGKSSAALEKQLKNAGVEYKKRQKLMVMITDDGEDKTKKEKVMPWYRRALATDEPGISQTTGVNTHDVRGGVSGVSVDTSAQGGRMGSRINPITSGAGPAVSGSVKPISSRPAIPLAR